MRRITTAATLLMLACLLARCRTTEPTAAPATCTGLPRQDFEWLFQFKGVTPRGALVTLGTMQPTSKFGELFQYSNPLAAAGGFVGGHVAFPGLELGGQRYISREALGA